MKRYKLVHPTKPAFEADTCEEIAGILRTLESSVQSFLSKNKKSNLTYQNWKCEDRQAELELAKNKALEEKLREKILKETKAELAAEQKTKAKTK